MLHKEFYGFKNVYKNVWRVQLPEWYREPHKNLFFHKSNENNANIVKIYFVLTLDIKNLQQHKEHFF